MEDPDFFTNTRIAIVGLGLMGGSLALGLRAHCQTLMAVDPDPIAHDLALESEIVDQISTDPADILPHAEIIILAAPVGVILEFIPLLPDLTPESSVIIDIGSTKAQICLALNELPSRFEPIGGHPMCGKAIGGLSHADADLFHNAPFAFTPLPRTTERARETADQLAYALGAQPLWVGPKTHDSWVAATSHLPHLLATALVLSTETEASHLVGPGFRSTSRLASSPSSVILPIMESNRPQILEAITRFRLHLDNLEDSLTQGDYNALKNSLDLGADHKALLTGNQA
ncbi:MAG: prephenate dehydrogenase/arogenate dehydrogenase family protein [Anaerolineales bacterium]|nr:prephenate dehydrogenase/arogenate dehydrogenase family protein [Anaerolineales bacterium]